MMHQRHAVDSLSKSKKLSLPTTGESHRKTDGTAFSRKIDHIVRICKIWWLTSSVHLRAAIVMGVAVFAIVLLVWGECYTPSRSSRGSQGDDLRHIKHFARQLERLVKTETSLDTQYKQLITKPFQQVLNHDDIYSDPIVYKSLRWMVRSYTPDEEIEESTLLQRYALANLYFATGGDEFWLKCSFHRPSATPCNDNNEEVNTRKIRFLTWTRNECDWYGVTCNEKGRVARLSWMDNGLARSFVDEDKAPSFCPPELLLLESLELLWWSRNPDLEGTLPPWISQMTNLRSLSMHDTAVSGTLPSELYTMTNLESIRLYNSELKGTLSGDIAKLTALSWLWLHANQFSSSIPSELGLLTNLVGLTVHRNEFENSEELPMEVCSLRKHHKLDELWTDCLRDPPKDKEQRCACCTKCLLPSA